MNARTAIFKRDFSLQSFQWKPIYLYSILVLTLLLGTALLQRFALSTTYPALGNITPAEQLYVAYAEKLCRKLAPQIDQFQQGLVTQSTPPKEHQGLISVQLSDLEERHHFHVIIQKNTGELVVLSQVVRNVKPDFLRTASRKNAVQKGDIQAECKAAMEIARRHLRLLCEIGAIPSIEPLGVTVERHGNYIVQWHYSDYCIIMDIRPDEKLMGTFRLRRHPRPLTETTITPSGRICPYCQGFGKRPQPAYANLRATSPSSNHQ